MALNYNREQKFSPLVRKMQPLKDENTCCKLMIETYGHHLDKVIAVIESQKGKVQRELHLMPLLVVELPLSGLKALADSRHVIKIWDDVQAHIVLDRSVSETSNFIMPELGYIRKGIVVAVLDTGIYPHDDLITPYNRILAWNDLINQENSPYDDNGHGTHIAGIIAGNGLTTDGKDKGIVPEARLVGIKVLNQEGTGAISNVISGIEWCLDHQSTLNTRIINLSFRTIIQESAYSDPLCRAAATAWKKGIIVCKAAGDSWPCFSSINTNNPIGGRILVGKSNEQQVLTEKDLHRDRIKGQRPNPDSLVKPEIVAPGTEITSLGMNGGYATLSGNSIATAFVSGAAARILQKWPHYNPDQVKYLLLKRASDLGLGVDLQGAGILDLEKMFNQGKAKKLPVIEKSNPGLDIGLIPMILNMVSQNPGFFQKASQLIGTTMHSMLNNRR